MRLELNRKCEGCNFWGSAYLWQNHWLCYDCLPSKAQDVADEQIAEAEADNPTLPDPDERYRRLMAEARIRQAFDTD